jgi:hypothetical protein
MSTKIRTMVGYKISLLGGYTRSGSIAVPVPPSSAVAAVHSLIHGHSKYGRNPLFADFLPQDVDDVDYCILGPA